MDRACAFRRIQKSLTLLALAARVRFAHVPAMNLPNQLTVARLVLSVFFVACLSVRFPFNHTLALAIFLIATATDYLDGEIARKHNLITDFGKLMDPLADKILTAAAFICLIPYGALPAWVVIVIIAREFLITGLRLLAGAKGVVLPAEKLGKHKTGWQMATIIFLPAPARAGRLEFPPPRLGADRMEHDGHVDGRRDDRAHRVFGRGLFLEEPRAHRDGVAAQKKLRITSIVSPGSSWMSRSGVCAPCEYRR